MFALGFEESTDNFLYSMRRSGGIALFGAPAPFVVACGIADYVWNDPNVSLMCGLAMTATAVSLTLVSLQGLGLHKSVVATRIMTSAVLDDIGSLVMVAFVVPLAPGQECSSTIALALTAGNAVAFFLIVTVMGILIFPGGPARWLKELAVVRALNLRGFLAFIVMDIACVQHKICRWRRSSR